MTTTSVALAARRPAGTAATPWRVAAAVAAGCPIGVADAVGSVCDPEYPGVAIAELGMVDHVRVEPGRVVVGLVPTFSGCPALGYLADDVRRAVEAVADACTVSWLDHPVWTAERISARGRTLLAEEFTVAVADRSGSISCPVCGATEIEDRSPVGPTRCRSVAWCVGCRNVVEVMR